MVFTSHIFVYYFLPFVLAVYYLIPAARLAWRNAFLLVVSYVFYAWAAPWYLVLMFAATVIAYVGAARIARLPVGDPRRRNTLAAAVAIELLLLGCFKYLGFFQHTVNGLLALIPAAPVHVWEIVLPIGISFYVFHTLSYVVDIYRGICAPTRNFADFACYVALFPQLVAGPILRYNVVAPFLTARRHTLTRFKAGSGLFILGFAKKVLLANQVGAIADAVFRAETPSTGDAWFGVVAYAFQIYFDFSAYSDMATGLGRMFGFEFPPNFNSPYRSESITDFWRRWHISLSTFLRDYLYIPLGGNRIGPARTYLNLIIVMLLGGLWHGANWTFVAWGAFHGVLLALERATDKKCLYAWLPRPLRMLATFVLVLFSWVLFRSATFHEASRMLTLMLQPAAASGGSVLLAGEIYQTGSWIMMILCAVLAVIPKEADGWVQNLGWGKIIALALLWGGSLAMLSAQDFNPFLYFQF